MTITLSTLKKAKNTVIGNPSAKLNLARDTVFIRILVDCLNHPNPSEPEIRIEAAHVIASLSYGSNEALSALLHANAPRAFLYAISRFTLNDSIQLRAAFVRGLRALAGSVAEVVGPSMWGLAPELSFVVRNEARAALDYLFQNDSLDIYLPLLTSPTSTSTSIQTSIAHLLSTSIRTPTHRLLVSSWLPPSARTKDPKSRGWEKPEAARAGGWVARCLGVMLGKTREGKLVEALLGALAALARDNPGVAGPLGKSGSGSDRDVPSVLSIVLSLSKSRSTEIQLAACLCATHIFRASTPHPTHELPSLAPSPSPAPSSPADSAYSAASLIPPPPNTHTHSHSHTHTHTHTHAHSHTYAQGHADDPCVRTVMNIVNRMLNPTPTPADSEVDPGNARAGMWVKTRACFILYYLVSDDPALCQAAYERGCLESLARVVWSITLPVPDDPFTAAVVAGGTTGAGVGGTTGAGAGGASVYEWEWHSEEEPEPGSALREAALTAIAAIALFDNDIRRFITSPGSFSVPSSSSSSFTSLTTPLPTTTTTTPLQTTSPAATTAATTPTPPTPTPTPLPLVPLIHASLHHKHIGTRYAACQCVRALARGVAVLRTNIVDGGLGMRVFGVFWRGVGGAGAGAGNVGDTGEREDRRVLGAALAAVCNIVNDFSPLKTVFLEQGLVPRLVRVLEMDDPGLRVSALWAVKNLLRKTAIETKREVMACIGWDRITLLLSDPDQSIQEQSLNVLRNLAEDEPGITLLLTSIPPPHLLDILTHALGPGSSTDVVLQAAYLLANLANGTAGQKMCIVRFPRVLEALRVCLEGVVGGGGGVEGRRPAVGRPVVGCVLELVRGRGRGRGRGEEGEGGIEVEVEVEGRRAVVEAGFEGVLRRICEFGGEVGGVGVGVGGEDRDEVVQARIVLDWIERGDVGYGFGGEGGEGEGEWWGG